MKDQNNHQFHTPVLLNEVVEGLNVKQGCWYIDATAGGGGHTELILKKGGKVLAIDQDNEAIKYLKQKYISASKKNVLIIQEGNFKNLKKIVAYSQIHKIYGILFDLGTSHFQILRSRRGFSFTLDEPLDMRMSQKSKLTAQNIINEANNEELYEIFLKFGEERLAWRIAQAIVRSRTQNKLINTGDLRGIITAEYLKAGVNEKIHPATRIFQALRIAVNDELNSLRQTLPQAEDLLEVNGRCLVISFHSLEDRIVKNYFLRMEKENKDLILTKKPIRPSKQELIANPSARSAKLRILEKQN